MIKSKKTTKHLSPFYMASASFPQIINKLVHGHITSLLVLATLEDCSNDYGATMIDQSDISKCIKKSTGTIQKAIRYLKIHGYIKVFLINNHNLYVINPNMLWHTNELTRASVAKNFSFPSIIRLTYYDNRKYYKAHQELKSHSEIIKPYKETVFRLVTNDKRIKSKIISSTTRQDSLKSIKQLIHNIKFSPREKQVVKFLLNKIPIKANKALKLTNKDIVNTMNKTITKSKHVGYTTVAHATTKLKQYNVIVRHHKSIAFNPIFMPTNKKSLH